MILSHFTSRYSINKIKAGGIKLCRVPWKINEHNGKVDMMGGLQWLTLDNDWDQQDWSVPGLLAEFPIRKTDYRVTVAIPSLASHNCIPWALFAQKHGLPVDEYFQTFPSRKWWYVYIGKIPPGWIVESVRNPEIWSLADEVTE